MSIMTTSASSLSAMARATVAPTFPAPPTTVTFRFMYPSRLHLGDHAIAELRALHFGCPFHQAREVVGDGSGRDSAVHPLHDQVGGLVPAEMAQHHFTGQDHRTRVDLVLAGVLGRRSMG